MSNPDVSDYYRNFYLKNCASSLSSSFFTSKAGFSLSARIIASISIPIQLLTFYCIWKKTPQSMKSVKSSLLNLNFWYFFTGLTYSFLSCPYFFHPQNAGFYIGFLTNFGVSTALQSLLSCLVSLAMVISIMALFENRSSLISSNRFQIVKNRTRRLWIFLNFAASMGLVIPIYLNLPDQNLANRELLTVLPCPPVDFFSEDILVFSNSGFWESYTNVSITMINIIFLFQILFFSTCCLYYLFHAKSGGHVSSETRRLQIRSFYGTVLQTVIPIIFLLVPTVILIAKQGSKEFSQEKNNLTFLPAILHKGVASACVILVHYPYREFLVSIVCGRRRKVIKISTASNCHL